MVNHILGRSVNYDELSSAVQSEIRQFSDLPTTHWGYNIMIEAANSHGFDGRNASHDEYWTEIIE
jgi:hypothetical protein